MQKFFWGYTPGPPVIRGGRKGKKDKRKIQGEEHEMEEQRPNLAPPLCTILI